MNEVYLLTKGSGEDGNPWELLAIFKNREAAERSKVDFDTEKHFRPDGTFYYQLTNDIEEWPIFG